VELLNAVLQYRTVAVAQHIGSNDDSEVLWLNADESKVVRCVVQLAQTEPIRDDGLAQGVSVWIDVRGVEQISILELAHRALILIRREYALAKCALVKSAPHQ
jgi:hypothetical protein